MPSQLSGTESRVEEGELGSAPAAVTILTSGRCLYAPGTGSLIIFDSHLSVTLPSIITPNSETSINITHPMGPGNPGGPEHLMRIRHIGVLTAIHGVKTTAPSE